MLYTGLYVPIVPHSFSHSGAGACCYVAETTEPTTIRVWSPRTQIPGYIAGVFNENEAQSGSTCKLFGTPYCCLLNILLVCCWSFFSSVCSVSYAIAAIVLSITRCRNFNF